MASKNRPRTLINDIARTACTITSEYYDADAGYKISQHGNEIWVDKWSKKHNQYLPALTIEIKSARVI